MARTEIKDGMLGRRQAKERVRGDQGRARVCQPAPVLVGQRRWDSQSDSGRQVLTFFLEEGFHGWGKDKDWKARQD